VATPIALKVLLEALKTEQEKRSRLRGRLAGDAREILHRKLDAMAERLKAAPDYVELSPEQKALNLQELHRFFAEHCRRQG
jgi:hypothetical protein